MIRKGTIKGFYGFWGSGLATLLIEDEDTKQLEEIPCDNGPTVRALDSAFGDVITDAHTVNVDAIRGKKIYWGMDDYGLCLGWILPVGEANVELRKAYRAQRRAKKQVVA